MSTLKREWRTRLVSITASAAVASMGAMVIVATASAAAPADTIKARQEGLKAMGGAAKTINDTLKTDSPDKAAIKAAGAKYTAAAEGMPHWFPKGTGPESGAKTDAKPEIWTNSAEFAEKMKAFQTEAGKLVALTDAGDVEGVREQIKVTGKTCGACHENFRVKKAT